MLNGSGSALKYLPFLPLRERKRNLPSRRLLRSLRQDESRLNRGGAPISIWRAEQGRGREGSWVC
uniref:Uncharacterized protein n=1 Tax=Oryza punctata TaxID=4537 RepID=A0A0E0L313_ORYPU